MIYSIIGLNFKKMRAFKKLCLIVLSMGSLLLNTAILQAQPVDYSYDDNGSRIRRYVTLKSGKIHNEENPVDHNTKITEEETEKLVDKIQDIQITVFPNPTPGQLNVNVEGAETEFFASYQVFSQTGLLLDQKNTFDNFFQIDFSNYQDGIYILNLMINGNPSVWHIIKK
jgi:hypothetical protein